jgi:hypothetical protein
MKITLFTSNKNRHNYLINLLSTVAEELFVVQECETIFPGITPGNYQASLIMKEYFQSVNIVQSKLFGNSYINNSNKNVKILPILFGDLNHCSMKSLSDFLKSDIYLIFGSSFIKSELVEFLIENRAINIHAGVSPYYRGTDCNFWALYDGNPHLVGTTIHLLSKGLDNGPILYHAMSNFKTNPFEYTMSSVKSAFHSVAERIKDNSIFKIDPIIQEKKKEIRYSNKSQFNEEVVKKYFEKKISLNAAKFNQSLLKEPFFFNS